MNTIRLAILAVCALFLLGLRAAPRVPMDSLSPDEPLDYLVQGERLIALAVSPEQLRVGQQTLVLGVALNVKAGDTQGASSCCIALASTLGDSPDDARAIWDLALMLDPSRLTAWAANRTDDASQGARASAAECVRLARNADTNAASALFSQPRVREAIRASATMLGYDSASILAEIEQMLKAPGRDPCRGQVFEAVVNDGVSTRVICDHHEYPISTARSGKMLTQLLAIEADCLGAMTRIDDWGGTSALGLDLPMREPSVAWLLNRFGVDPQRAIWRNGHWSTQP